LVILHFNFEQDKSTYIFLYAIKKLVSDTRLFEV